MFGARGRRRGRLSAGQRREQARCGRSTPRQPGRYQRQSTVPARPAPPLFPAASPWDGAAQTRRCTHESGYSHRRRDARENRARCQRVFWGGCSVCLCVCVCPRPQVWKWGEVEEAAGRFQPSPAPFHARAGSVIHPSALLINAFLFIDTL